MYLDSFLKILLGFAILLPCYSFIRREINGELRIKNSRVFSPLSKSPMDIFYLGFILGVIVIFIGIGELLQ